MSQTDTGAGVDADLRKRREEIVRRHAECELKGDWDGWKATFAPGRISYDLPAFGGYRNEEESLAFLKALYDAVTDWTVEFVQIHHADDAVIGEVKVEYVATAPSDEGVVTKKKVSSRQCVIFRFDGDQLWQEVGYGAPVEW